MAWTVADSEELYGVPHWGNRLFHVNNDGHLVVSPRGPDKGDVDLHDVVEALDARGVDLPVLIRMPQVTERRIDLINAVFAKAIKQFRYEGRYRGVYPIKVNQQRQVVEELLRSGRRHHVGLEAGSKPELLVAMAMMDDPDGLIICNGYKDRRYIEMALMAQRLGQRTVVVVEKLSELDTILDLSAAMGVKPMLGVRARLSSPGHGRWQSSAGDRAKFGLSTLGIVELVERLRAAEQLDCLRLLHFHIGSQVPSIQTFKAAFREATRTYTELVCLGAPMGTIDVGGGLGVDYDGSRTTMDSSRNYTIAEYTADVVAHVGDACDEAGVDHPDIVTESGRTTVAHGSVLLFDILGVESRPVDGAPAEPTDADTPSLRELRAVYASVSEERYQEAWHDALDVRARSCQAFELGVMGLMDLAAIERLFWVVCHRIAGLMDRLDFVPEEMTSLRRSLADTYYGNFSIFQSIPDAWAIEQLFPCMPIHRLDEEPVRRAVIGDLTCDSDGKLSRFVNRRGAKRVLELHRWRDGERYVVAVALVGAYQEILGDMHNLFGDTHAVHLSVADDGEVSFDHVIDGDTVEDVAAYVQYDRKDLVQRMRHNVENAIRRGSMDRGEAARVLDAYRSGLDGYTYLGH